MNSVKQKVYTNILISVSIALAMFYFGLIYFVEEEKSLSLEIIDKKKEIEQLKSRSEQIGEIRGVYQEWQEKTETILESVARRSKLSDYIIEIRDVADKNNIDLEINVSAKDKEKINDNFSYTYYKIKATGFFDDIMKFLTCVENLKYYSETENISFAIENESKARSKIINSKSEKILLSADLKIYMYHDNKDAAGIE